MDSKDENEPTQSINAREGSTIRNVIQAIIHLPAWAWITGVAVFSISLLMISAMFNIGPLRELLPTPTAFAPATGEESLLIVADFENRSGGKYTGIDPAQYVYEQLVVQIQKDNLNIRVERLRQVVDDNTAKSAGNIYNATLVVWGWYDALTITPRIARIKTLKGKASNQEGSRISLTDPDKVEFSVVTDLPSQTAYLTMFTIGIDKYSNEKFDEALAYFDNAVQAVDANTQASTNPSEAYFFRANIYYDRSEYDRAIADYDKTVELNPDDPVAYFFRGDAYLAKGDYDRAFADYDKAIELNPDDAGAYFFRGMAYNIINEYDRAIADYDKMIKLSPDDADGYFFRGDAYSNKDDYDRAIVDYDKSIQLKPDLAEAYYHRGYAYYYKGDYNRAFADLDKAIQLKPDYVAEIYYGRGNAYYGIGDYDRAIADYAKVIELNPDDADVYNSRCWSYYEMGKYELALPDCEKAVALSPDQDYILDSRAFVYASLGHTDEAIKDFERILEISTDPELRKRAEDELKKLKVE